MRIPTCCSLLAASMLVGVIACGGEEVSFPVKAAEEFTASLNNANEVPASPVPSSATGSAIFSVIDDTLMSWRVDVEGIDSITQAHIHVGDASSSGGVIVNLFLALTTACRTNTDTAMTIVTSSAENPTKITTIGPHRMTGTVFVRIAGHTGSVPSLEGTHTATVIDATTFSIPVAVTAPGAGGTVRPFVLSNITSPRCRVAYTGALAQAQSRPANFSAAGQPALYLTLGDSPRSRWEELIARMRSGSVYVNVHTVRNPNGEIRGQLGPR
jgi:hypothetical protein